MKHVGSLVPDVVLKANPTPGSNWIRWPQIKDQRWMQIHQIRYQDEVITSIVCFAKQLKS